MTPAGIEPATYYVNVVTENGPCCITSTTQTGYDTKQITQKFKTT